MKSNGWKHKPKTKLVVGTETNPTKLESGQVVINKKATKQNLDRLIEINNDGLDKPIKKEVTTDGTEGGLLKGKPHYDKNGNSLGGIPAVVDGAKNIETEGEEFLLNKEASQKHWKELSKINQSAGNGVPINPSDVGADEDPEEFRDGGTAKIEFNPNHIPSKWIYSYAKKIKEKYPKVWDMGGNIFGNEAFNNLERVLKRGYWTDNEEWMYIKWRSYVARHHKDFRIAGTVAMLKWIDKTDKGWDYMKHLIDKEIKKRYSKEKMANGGGVKFMPQQGTLLTKDKKLKLDYKKNGNDFEFVVYEGETNPVENYTKTSFKKKQNGVVTMDYNQFINYIYSEGYIDDKNYALGGELIKRADGSYSKRGLWDNIRENIGSGKKPTKQMLQQEAKIRSKMQTGGGVESNEENGKIRSFPINKLIALDWKIKEVSDEIKRGELSYSKNEPALVSYVPHLKKYLILDGHHRILEQKHDGKKSILARISKHVPKTYNLSSEVINVSDKQYGYGGVMEGQPPANFENVLYKELANRYELGGIFHGSPYKFEKFTTEKIGTGEGAQAFGWGLYFTDLENIGESYAKTLAQGKSNSQSIAQYFYGVGYTREQSDDIMRMPVENQIEIINSAYDRNMTKLNKKEDGDFKNHLIETQNKLRSRLISEAYQVSPFLYKVTLFKGKNPEEYNWLDWSKPISEKNKNKIVNGLYDLVEYGIGFGNRPYLKFPSGKIVNTNIQKSEIKNYLKEGRIFGNGSEVYDQLSSMIGSQKETSLFLLKNGIDGVKYPAESISKGKTDDTARGFNYVVFDENAVAIDEIKQFKNGGTTDDFDWESLFNPSEEEEENIRQEIKKQEEQEREEEYQKSNYSKRWASTFKEAVEKTVQSYLDAKATYEDWGSRQYKSNKGVVFAGGDDIHGNAYTIGGINEYRRKRTMAGAKMQMDEELETLKKLGLSQQEIADLTENKMKDGGNVEDEKKKLKLEILKLTSKAFKQFSGSPNQNKTMNEISKLREQLDKLGGTFENGGKTESHEDLESRIMKQQFGI